mmetsp:Transcript_26404/g.66445  ORF Transcript_26404/g.66445 Transcript_26404/m.66445 type:complete len:261 (+) Transcript_26404:429-1211(+)
MVCFQEDLAANLVDEHLELVCSEGRIWCASAALGTDDLVPPPGHPGLLRQLGPAMCSSPARIARAAARSGSDFFMLFAVLEKGLAAGIPGAVLFDALAVRPASVGAVGTPRPTDQRLLQRLASQRGARSTGEAARPGEAGGAPAQAALAMAHVQVAATVSVRAAGGAAGVDRLEGLVHIWRKVKLLVRVNPTLCGSGIRGASCGSVGPLLLINPHIVNIECGRQSCAKLPQPIPLVGVVHKAEPASHVRAIDAAIALLVR